MEGTNKTWSEYRGPFPAQKSMYFHHLPYDFNNNPPQSQGNKIRRNSRRNYCAIAVFLVVFLVFIAGTIAIAVVFTLPEDEVSNPTGTPNTTSLVDLQGTITLSWEWVPDLSDKNSELFSQYHDTVCNEIEEYFTSTSLSSNYEVCSVEQFREGSVIVQFVVEFSSFRSTDLAIESADVLLEACNQQTFFDGAVLECTLDDGGIDNCPRPASTGQCSHTCEDKIYGYECKCPDGWKLGSDLYNCEDIDECKDNAITCHHICINNIGSYNCECYTGYELDSFNNKNCFDIDECIGDTNPCVHSCVNSEGSYTCKCNQGFRLDGNGKDCIDLNECTENTHTCEHICVNNNGSYICECFEGYELDSENNCIDINKVECNDNTANCDHICNNNYGSFVCECYVGYRLHTNGRECVDINECTENIHTCDHFCINNNGSYTCCEDWHFHCTSGECLIVNKTSVWCNKVEDCADGSDEPDDCECTDDQFNCFHSGKCIDPAQVCDGISQCSKGEDEVGCPCDGFECGNKECLPSWRRCNKVVDCSDSSDEIGCDCSSDFTCDNGVCITQSKVCNYINNCGDWSDETSCACSDSDFVCPNGVCVRETRICDGYSDCAGYEDEMGCDHCNDKSAYFQCNITDTCVPISQRCDEDRIQHCPNGEDELFCDCGADGILCNNTGICGHISWLCDGIPDCEDGEDEMDCGGSCPEHTCKDYQGCYQTSARCDGKYTCTDQSDESYCWNTDETIPGLILINDSPLCYSDTLTESFFQEYCDELSLGSHVSWAQIEVDAVSSLYTSYKLHDPDRTPTSVPINKLYYYVDVSSCQSGHVITVYCQHSPGYCGQSSVDPVSLPHQMIVNSNFAPEGGWPWQVSLQRSDIGIHICGGALIAPNWVVTAAHCIQDQFVSTFQVGLGNIDSYKQDLYFPEEMHIHPLYNDSTNEADIALVKLKDGATYTDYISPVCLSESDQDLSQYDDCYLTGWGKISADHPVTQRFLKQAKMPLLTAEMCNSHKQTIIDNADDYDDYYDYISRPNLPDEVSDLPDVNGESMICAGYLSGLSAGCYGDSGGPLVCRTRENRWTLVGVQNFGVFCKSFSVFADIRYYRNWMDNIMTEK